VAELVRTNDVGLISVIESLLAESDIPYHVADRNISLLEGSIGAFQMRVLVPDQYEAEAREVLTEAELAHWLRRR
jgi:MinD-like ATPase involved in chromosome partitioning or flagellar assembly